jgi:hypothetical protein
MDSGVAGYFTDEYLAWWILGIVGAVLVGLMSLYHDKIVNVRIIPVQMF